MDLKLTSLVLDNILYFIKNIVPMLGLLILDLYNLNLEYRKNNISV